MIKKILIIAISAALSIFMLAACENASGASDQAEETAGSASDTAVQVQTTVADSTNTSLDFIELDYSSADEDSSYNENTATSIKLSDGNTQIDGSGAQEKDDVITITDEGEYVISGTLSDGQIVVDASDSDVVQIILSGVCITNKSGSAVIVNKAEKLVLTLAEGTENTVEDGPNYDDSSEEAPDAAIYAGEDLTINGSGILGVTGNYMSGIKCVDNLILMSGQISVTAKADGIRGKDSLTVNDADITINAGADGMKSNNEEDEDSGYIIIEGGNMNITAADAGIKAETGIIIDGGVFGIEAQQDTINCNGSIRIAGGDITLSADDDGMHANDTLEVLGGNITVLQSYEGLEGAKVSILGGNITITSSDDGINAAGGSDGMGGRDMFNQSGDYSITIGGGMLYINAGGDGVDSNGSLYFTGGFTSVSGPTNSANGGLDSNGVLEVSGGTLVVLSSAGMMEIPDSDSQPLLTVVFSSDQQAGETYSLSDSSDNLLFTVTAVKTFRCVMITSEDLTLDETYTFFLGGTSSGDVINEVLMSGGSLSGGSEMFTVTLNDYITTVDESGNAASVGGMGGGPGGGMPGGERPGPR